LIIFGGNLFFFGRNLFFENTPTYFFDSCPGTWTAGPPIPDNLGQTDAPGAMMANGKILIPLRPSGTYNPPTFFYEYDYLSNSFLNVGAPGGTDSIVWPVFTSNMLDLPDGNVLVSTQESSQFFVYTPVGPALAAGKPTIGTVAQNGKTYTITGTQFNGISEGTGYGDDWQMSSNYPLVRLTSGAKVYYARSFNWNNTGVQTGNFPDTVQFCLPSGFPPGIYSLVVVVNGNPSDSVAFRYYPCANDSNALSFLTINTGNDTLVCNGVSVNLAAAASGGIGSVSYNWMPGNLTGASPVIHPSLTTSYTVVASDANGCMDTSSFAVTISIPLGTVNEKAAFNLIVFPDPATDL